jgi:hypothetical protein
MGHEPSPVFFLLGDSMNRPSMARKQPQNGTRGEAQA